MKSNTREMGCQMRQPPALATTPRAIETARHRVVPPIGHARQREREVGLAGLSEEHLKQLQAREEELDVVLLAHECN
jgi:hypothetical protein